MSTKEIGKPNSWECEDADVDVPKKYFTSVITWAYYESTKSYDLLMMIGWYGGLMYGLYSTIFTSHIWRFQILFLLLEASVVLAPVICMTLIERRAGYLISRNNKKLAEATKEVFSSKQENLVLGWDKVASVLNRKFYVAGDWKTPYCIFDGAKCESYFRRHVLKSMAEEDASEDCEKSCLRAAVDIYRRRIIDQFEWDKYDTPVLADDNFLAGSDHKEFTWRLRNTLKDLHFIVYFVTSLFVLLAGTRSLLLCMIMTILMFATIAARPPLELSTTRSRIRLLATIADVAPREDMDRWDVVARRMNAYLSQDSNSDAGIFFDGKDYLEFFEKQLKPLMSKKIKDYRVATYELVPLIADVVEGPST
ncbi:uncharacterized protein TDEL_0D00660 [Torulaspora delbrueckii]|uniref:Uncharacterized protein n=1 Tax=Torulaspora delbrueckii TaxID=4950 RepID=G8ZSQ6_TORDE|nr:hypothetical protein TDEL_0D00660 [Torulaspora delbrueckii]CCE91650.1 hypothetical protein TDEL_0D00660 [Torulaspora delbrueckii]